MRRSASFRTRLALEAIVAATASAVLACPSMAADVRTGAGPSGGGNRPNILLILADDLGYSDIGAFGGEIQTPNLDALARSGLQLTNFHVSPACSPTRAMLMAGTDNHVAGLGTMAELPTPEQKGKAGYEGTLGTNVVPFPELLRDAGYHTYMAGKWHLGMTEELSPPARGFEQSYAMLQGGAGFFDQTGNAPPPDGKGTTKARYRENGKPAELPKIEYTTNFYTDKVIEYIGSNKADGKPFFAYAAYTAPHFPLQAPDHLIEKYKDTYKAGYEVIRNERFKRMQAAGLIPANMTPSEPPALWPKWEQLSQQQKDVEARRMAVYAAMVDSLDQNIGRLVSYLKEIGAFDNTIIVFLSDNGAEGNDILDLVPATWVEETFDNSLDNIGRPGSYVGYGPGWGHVSAAPFRLFKAFPTEGGVRSPTIISYPKLAHRGKIDGQISSVMDLAPTFLEAAGVEHPGSSYNGRAVHAMQGTSLWSYLNGRSDRVHPKDYVLGMELFGRASVKKGDWKLVWVNKPWGTGGWELYNLADDPGETRNLIDAQPEKAKEMMASWDEYREKNGVIFDEKIAGQLQYSNGTRYYQELEW
ncbi:arylsulfatase [Azospirillum sp. YIM DDC1]|uniref:Arylsulfatase n=1 Tax=Azospirillum aestuarii TaxID=2802052 RepID=A0ABS1I8U5_9PROT|nr:arylsulfatase [Azospirillum aestuarii]MBK4723470.1 arylsulfatase [Azospirillum aestuarii]